MGFVRNLTLAYGCGSFAVLVFLGMHRALAYIKVPQMLGFEPRAVDFPAGLYRLLVWGGIWALLLALPVLRRAWWARGLLLGIFATLAIPLYFNEAFAKLPVPQQVYALLLNCFWGLCAAVLYRAFAGTGEERRFGMR